MNERPTLKFYHANAKGTGCALSLSLYPLRIGELESGAIVAKFARQKTLGDRRTTPPVYPTFDFDNAATVRLDFNDLAKMLQVFRGECESIEEGKGLYHVSAERRQRITLRHVIEPICGYCFEVYESASGAEWEDGWHIFLSNAEALGLSLAIEHSFAAIAFGVADGWKEVE